MCTAYYTPPIYTGLHLWCTLMIYEILLMQRYLSWLNEQLLSVGKHVENISESLADGVLMIQALVVSASHDTFAVHCSIACMHNRFLCIIILCFLECLLYSTLLFIISTIPSMLLERSHPSTILAQR